MHVAASERDRERKGTKKQQHIAGEVPLTSHECHLSVTSPKGIFPQAVLKDRHLDCRGCI